MTRRITTRAVIVNEKGEIFCVRQKHDDDSVNDFWCTPGGGLDPLESLDAGLHREMIEETGIAPHIGKLLFVQQYKEHDGSEKLEFFFHVLNTDDYTDVNLSDTTHGELELVEFGFVKPKKENILPTFLAKVDFSNLPETTQVISYL